jgi:hypothetical protein
MMHITMKFFKCPECGAMQDEPCKDAKNDPKRYICLTRTWEVRSLDAEGQVIDTRPRPTADTPQPSTT